MVEEGICGHCKGIEIGAYEVAKAGIYVAIGVATAALSGGQEPRCSWLESGRRRHESGKMP